jgi:2-methylaconitate cis-trans-isomerase PrpF
VEREFAGEGLGIDLREGLSGVELESEVNQARRQLAELMRLRLMASHEAAKGQPEVAFEG